MTTYRAVLTLCMFIIILTVLGCTAERWVSRVSWIGAAVLSGLLAVWTVL